MVDSGDTIDTGFTLDVVKNGEERTVPFSELLDRPTVVSVYMKNNTTGCDRQNRSLAEHYEWFDRKGYNVVAVSKDSCRSHRNYVEKLDIGYVLASDPDYKFARAVDSIVEKNMFGNKYEAPSRSAYVIDTDGTVLGTIEKVDTGNHAGELKELIENIE